MPYIIKKNSGRAMVNRLDKLIKMLKLRGETFVTYTHFTEQKKQVKS
jgi:hypothetical protein